MGAHFLMSCAQPEEECEPIKKDEVTLGPGEVLEFYTLLDEVRPFFMKRWPLKMNLNSPYASYYQSLIGDKEIHMRELVAQEGYHISWGFYDNTWGSACFDSKEILPILEAIRDTIAKRNAELPKLYEFQVKVPA